MSRYECDVCAYIFDEATSNTKWEDLPDDWVCPVCGSDKSYFKLLNSDASNTSNTSNTSDTANQTDRKEISEKRICSVCGYIVKRGFNGQVCPACGVPHTAFQPYVDRVSAKRRKILDLHTHNILVHFPQAFSLLMLFLIFMSIFIKGSLQFEFLITSEILSIFLPLSILVSIISGIIDGKNRFKRIDTPILKRKIGVASVFLTLSVVIFFLFQNPKLEIASLTWILLVLTGLCSFCSLFLGYKGGGLSRAEIPG